MRGFFFPTSPTTGFTIYFLRILCSVCLYKGLLGESLPSYSDSLGYGFQKIPPKVPGEGATLEVKGRMRLPVYL